MVQTLVYMHLNGMKPRVLGTAKSRCLSPRPLIYIRVAFIFIFLHNGLRNVITYCKVSNVNIYNIRFIVGIDSGYEKNQAKTFSHSRVLIF